LRTFRCHITIDPEIEIGRALGDPQSSLCHLSLLLRGNVSPNYTVTRSTKIDPYIVFELGHVGTGKKAYVVALIKRLVSLKGVENVLRYGERLRH
jgi:hypothetical protein